MARVLIVEDDEDVLAFMELLLTTSGYDTMVARNGLEALKKMREVKPCVVLLDLQMPIMDGWVFREQQMADAQLSDVPVVGVTACCDPREVTARLGIPCLGKPADFPDVLHQVSVACGTPAS